MKKLILSTTFLIVGTFGVLAQGLMDFSNASWEAWTDTSVDRLIYKSAGVPVDDATWSAQLMNASNPGNLVAIGDRVNFLGVGLEGMFASDGTQRTAPAGALAVAIYDGAGQMLAWGGGAGGAGTTFTFTQGASIPPSPTDFLMVNFRGFVVPEPSTIALGVLGLGALLLFRRR